MGKAFGKTVAALAAAVAAALLALNGADVLAVPRPLLVAAIVASAVLAAVTTSASAWGEWHRRRLGARRAAADFQLSATLWAVFDHAAVSGSAPLDYRDLGLAVYRVRRLRWWPWRTRLVRQLRIRAARRPTTSDVDWRIGKGVIGSCVAHGEVVGLDLRDLYDGLGTPAALDWQGVPDDVRMGLDHREYVDLAGKYEVVVAVPIIDEHGAATKASGCVALDGPHGQLATLSSPEVVDLLNNLVQSLLLQSR